MKKIKITFFALLCYIGMEQLNAQTTTTQKSSDISSEKSSGESSQPKAVVTYKTPLQSNQLIIQINELTKGDDELTEKVIAYIHQTNTTTIRRVVNDNDFKSLSDEIKQEAIKESEVIALINQLKK